MRYSMILSALSATTVLALPAPVPQDSANILEQVEQNAGSGNGDVSGIAQAVKLIHVKPRDGPQDSINSLSDEIKEFAELFTGGPVNLRRDNALATNAIASGVSMAAAAVEEANDISKIADSDKLSPTSLRRAAPLDNEQGDVAAVEDLPVVGKELPKGVGPMSGKLSSGRRPVDNNPPKPGLLTGILKARTISPVENPSAILRVAGEVVHIAEKSNPLKGGAVPRQVSNENLLGGSGLDDVDAGEGVVDPAGTTAAVAADGTADSFAAAHDTTDDVFGGEKGGLLKTRNVFADPVGTTAEVAKDGTLDSFHAAGDATKDVFGREVSDFKEGPVFEDLYGIEGAIEHTLFGGSDEAYHEIQGFPLKRNLDRKARNVFADPAGTTAEVAKDGTVDSFHAASDVTHNVFGNKAGGFLKSRNVFADPVGTTVEVATDGTVDSFKAAGDAVTDVFGTSGGNILKARNAVVDPVGSTAEVAQDGTADSFDAADNTIGDVFGGEGGAAGATKGLPVGLVRRIVHGEDSLLGGGLLSSILKSRQSGGVDFHPENARLGFEQGQTAANAAEELATARAHYAVDTTFQHFGQGVDQVVKVLPRQDDSDEFDILDGGIKARSADLEKGDDAISNAQTLTQERLHDAIDLTQTHASNAVAEAPGEVESDATLVAAGATNQVEPAVAAVQPLVPANIQT